MIPGAGPVWRFITQQFNNLSPRVSPKSNPTIVMLQAEAEFISKHNAVPFSCPCHHSSHHWRLKHLWFPVKGKQSNGFLADIPLCSKRR
ncbi:hypothetical protein TNCV_876291 [Trichonephila clavipes]|nr:hypothetical protein TNCV_876291 [Trichonephila clavipes]